MIRGMENLCFDDGLRGVGIAQPREEKTLGKPYIGLLVPKGSRRKFVIPARAFIYHCTFRPFPAFIHLYAPPHLKVF